jgi:hypothetical protein
VTELKDAKRLEQAPRRCPSSTFWLVVRHENRRMEVLMVGCSGEQALPVFSGEGEAKMFVWLEGAFEDGLAGQGDLLRGTRLHSLRAVCGWFCTYRRLANSCCGSSLEMATNRILASAREPPICLSTA